MPPAIESRFLLLRVLESFILWFFNAIRQGRGGRVRVIAGMRKGTVLRCGRGPQFRPTAQVVRAGVPADRKALQSAIFKNSLGSWDHSPIPAIHLPQVRTDRNGLPSTMPSCAA